MVRPRENTDHFDAEYGLASASLTTGKTVVATTQASYHGISIVASATKATIWIYDHASDTSGNLVDLIHVETNKSAWIDRYIPVQARNGLTVKATGAGLEGAVFYGPKG
jgi:hypothetical protein